MYWNARKLEILQFLWLYIFLGLYNFIIFRTPYTKNECDRVLLHDADVTVRDGQYFSELFNAV